MSENEREYKATAATIRPACHVCGGPFADAPDATCHSCVERMQWSAGRHYLRAIWSSLRSLRCCPSAAWSDLKARVRWPRFSLGETLGAITLLAVACAWPLLLIPAVALILVAILQRAGFTVEEGLVLVAILGVLIGLGLPSVASHRSALISDPAKITGPPV